MSTNAPQVCEACAIAFGIELAIAVNKEQQASERIGREVVCWQGDPFQWQPSGVGPDDKDAHITIERAQ